MGAIAIFGIVALCWYAVDFRLAACANCLAASQKKALYEKLLELQGRDLTALVDSQTYHQGFVERTNLKDPSREVGVKFDPTEGAGIRSVFIFDEHWTPRSHSSARSISSTDLDQVRRALRAPGDQLHFYSWHGETIEEYRAKPIEDETGTIRGYAIARAAWIPGRIDDLSRITESAATVVPPGQPMPPITDQAFTVSIPLAGADGKPVAELRFVVRTDAVLYAMNRSRLAGVFLLVLMIGLTSALMATVVRKLISPLGKLAQGLNEHDLEIANTFKSSPIEIAQLAQAISESFKRKNELDDLNKTLASTIESLNEANGQLSSYNEALEQRVQERTRDIAQAIETTIFGWSKAMDSRDHETEGHTRRVADMAQALGIKAGLDHDELQNLKFGALLHDIGKIGIPDSILLKPGKLTEGEFEVMRNHTLLGYEMLKDIPFLEDAVDVVLYHHERWDGGGYPYGLKEEEIPFAARLFAIADVWDALRSDRPYREAWSEERVREYIKEQAGLHFDPELVSLYLSLEPIKHPSDRKSQRKAA